MKNYDTLFNLYILSMYVNENVISEFNWKIFNKIILLLKLNYSLNKVSVNKNIINKIDRKIKKCHHLSKTVNKKTLSKNLHPFTEEEYNIPNV